MDPQGREGAEQEGNTKARESQCSIQTAHPGLSSLLAPSSLPSTTTSTSFALQMNAPGFSGVSGPLVPWSQHLGSRHANSLERDGSLVGQARSRENPGRQLFTVGAARFIGIQRPRLDCKTEPQASWGAEPLSKKKKPSNPNHELELSRTAKVGRSQQQVETSQERATGSRSKRARSAPPGTTVTKQQKKIHLCLPSDGYAWVKYGEKQLLFAHGARAYFRCSMSRASKCPAKKFVDLLSTGQGSEAGPKPTISYTDGHNHPPDTDGGEELTFAISVPRLSQSSQDPGIDGSQAGDISAAVDEDDCSAPSSCGALVHEALLVGAASANEYHGTRESTGGSMPRSASEHQSPSDFFLSVHSTEYPAETREPPEAYLVADRTATIEWGREWLDQTQGEPVVDTNRSPQHRVAEVQVSEEALFSLDDAVGDPLADFGGRDTLRTKDLLDN